MAKRDTDDLYGAPAGDPGPLFRGAGSGERGSMDGPFARSAMEPSADERWLAELLWLHQGRENPLSIRAILAARSRSIDEDWPATRLLFDERQVKGLVESLRRDHRVPIGALKTKDGGYFIMRDLDDERAGMKGYLSQVFTSLRTWRAMLSKEFLREMEGQIRMELEGGE